MWFLLSLLSKSRHDSARCLSRCLPLRMGAALLTPTEPNRFHREYSRARGYALAWVPYWTETLIFLHTVGNSLSGTTLRNVVVLLLQPSDRSDIPSSRTQHLKPQAASEVNAVASSLLGRATSPSQAWGIPPVFLMLASSPEATAVAKGRQPFCRATFRKGGRLAMSLGNVSSSPSYPSCKNQILQFCISYTPRKEWKITS